MMQFISQFAISNMLLVLVVSVTPVETVAENKRHSLAEPTRLAFAYDFLQFTDTNTQLYNSPWGDVSHSATMTIKPLTVVNEYMYYSAMINTSTVKRNHAYIFAFRIHNL